MLLDVSQFGLSAEPQIWSTGLKDKGIGLDQGRSVRKKIFAALMTTLVSMETEYSATLLITYQRKRIFCDPHDHIPIGNDLQLS